MSEKKLVMRPEIIPFMNLGTKDTPNFSQCGDGWKKFSENPNAQTDETQYINSASATTDTVSYKPQYAFECDLFSSETTIKKVYDTAKDRKTGSDCVFDFVIVDKFSPIDGSTTEFVARREQLSVAVSSIDGTSKMTMSGNLNAQGDGVKGKFNVDALIFTADNDSDTTD